MNQEIGQEIVKGIFEKMNPDMKEADFSKTSREISWAIVEGIFTKIKPIVKGEEVDFSKIREKLTAIDEEKMLDPREMVKDIMPTEKPFKSIAEAVFKADVKKVKEITDKALKEHSPKKIVDKGLTIGMAAVTKLYEDSIYFIPQVILSADAMSAGVAVIELKDAGAIEKKGKVIVHVAEGDVHDLGKNLAKVFLVADGWEVIDLGKDVPVDEVVKAIEEHKPVMISGTSLMTTTMSAFPKIAQKLIDKDIEIPFICGGSAISEEFINTFPLGIIGKKAHQAPKYADAADRKIPWKEIRKKWEDIAPI